MGSRPVPGLSADQSLGDRVEKGVRAGQPTLPMLAADRYRYTRGMAVG